MTKTKHKRGLKYAIRAACLSQFHCHRVGAALFSKNKLVSIGWNQKKTHPLCPTEHSQHAEFNACIGVDKMVLASGLSLYVVRLTKTGRIGIAKPCRDCDDFLRALGITKIFYTNRKGALEGL